MPGSVPTLSMLPLEKLPVLVVEDSEDDLFFFQRLIAKTGIATRLEVATDGQQAIAHLEQAISPHGEGRPVVVPKLIFLDLKLPLRSGFEVLAWIRQQPELSDVIVVVLSSSAEVCDVTQAFHFGAQDYLVKYPDPSVFVEVIERAGAVTSAADLKSLRLPGLARPESSVN